MRWSGWLLITAAVLLLLGLSANGESSGGRVFVAASDGDTIGLAVVADTIKPGVTCPTQPDNGAYKLHKWKLAGAVTYSVNPTTFPSNVDAGPAIDAAFTAWEATDLGDRFSRGADTSVATVAFDGTNAVFFAPLSDGTIAAAYVWYYLVSGNVAQFDVVFNSNYSWANLSGSGDCVTSSDFDVQDIATHETGHVVGVAHTSPNGANNAQSLYPYAQTGELYKRSLASGDIAGANKKY